MRLGGQVRLLNTGQCSLPYDDNTGFVPVFFFEETAMKSVTFENIRTLEQLVCDDLQNKCTIDGEHYLTVHRPNEQRTFLVRESVLRRTKEVKVRS